MKKRMSNKIARKFVNVTVKGRTDLQNNGILRSGIVKKERTTKEIARKFINGIGIGKSSRIII